MAVLCPACGRLSQDPKICEHCQAELAHSSLPPERCPLVPGGLELSALKRQILGRPQGAVCLNHEGKSWRIHWISRLAWSQWSAILEERQRHPIAALPPCRLIEETAGTWIVVETSGPRLEPWTATLADPMDEISRLMRFVRPLGQSLAELHSRGLVWFNFDPWELEAGKREDGSDCFRFTNLDLRVFPAGQCPERVQVKPAFAAPEINSLQEDRIGPASDVFHLALFCYYWLGRLLPDGFLGSGLESFEYRIPPLRIFIPELPPGIVPVLGRNLSLDPAKRFSSVDELCTAMEEAVARAIVRKNFSGSIRWESGGHTRAGRAKKGLQRDNQDQILVRDFTPPGSDAAGQAAGRKTLLAVADGISTCDVGNGALASRLSCLVLENRLDVDTSHEDFPEKVGSACHRATQAILDWALEKGFQPKLVMGAELMGTTMTAGWLEGNQLSLGHLGDSRVYLIHDQGVEQLTVDGDLASGLLANGTPPEVVRELGGLGHSLRECIGGCQVTPEGKVATVPEICRPHLSSWKVLPGDILVFCSDGLVEEGVFLDPGDLAELVRVGRDLSASALAIQLADAADALQRSPSPEEPDGYGDNISCIVVKVFEG